MYPFLRLYRQVHKARRMPALGLFDAHRSVLHCWPQDIDPWVELNNGRTLTLFDLGRVPMITRLGLRPHLNANGWSMAVAGASVRYRRRVKMFDRLEMISRLAGWDDKFLYIDQSLWRAGECTTQVLNRTAVTSGSGIIAPERLIRSAGFTEPQPELPGWIAAWARAEAERPWPPEAGRIAGNNV
ncbi:acyl-CoA thioesterase [Falsigemmobacter intermedius]|uniref:Acyl-CoA thioesterase n=1 Tax=Falsigemmobacter intermedius TaxID=1553448 RepID=A0A3S3YA63_9RHOB|nr:acyl-CoA thioesterase [Falsigemmobacter intermedius]RWY40022.1 acyl-CoA thioesterase [Falsigemmobacter intermedius]